MQVFCEGFDIGFQQRHGVNRQFRNHHRITFFTKKAGYAIEITQALPLAHEV